MFEYPYFADMVGTTVKSMFGAMITETEHKAVFNQMVDAKVKLNKDMYEASKSWFEAVQEVSKKATDSAWTDAWVKTWKK